MQWILRTIAATNMIGKVMTEMYNIQESAKKTRVGLDPAADYRIKVGQRFHQVG